MDGPERPNEGPDRPPRDGVFEPARLTDDHPRIGRWLMVAVIALLIVVAKPWAWGGASIPDDASGSGSGALVDVEASPSPDPTPAPTVDPDSAGPEVAAFCLDPGRWLLASIETYRGGAIRVWRALDPIRAATGPDDPDIPVTTLVSEGVERFGWCAPVFGDDRPVGTVDVSVWMMTAGGPDAMRMDLAQPFGEPSPFGALYRPPRTRAEFASNVDPWRDGRYIVRHRDAAGTEHWFAIEVATHDPVGEAP